MTAQLWREEGRTKDGGLPGADKRGCCSHPWAWGEGEEVVSSGPHEDLPVKGVGKTVLTPFPPVLPFTAGAAAIQSAWVAQAGTQPPGTEQARKGHR